MKNLKINLDSPVIVYSVLILFVLLAAFMVVSIVTTSNPYPHIVLGSVNQLPVPFINL